MVRGDSAIVGGLELGGAADAYRLRLDTGSSTLVLWQLLAREDVGRLNSGNDVAALVAGVLLAERALLSIVGSSSRRGM